MLANSPQTVPDETCGSILHRLALANGCADEPMLMGTRLLLETGFGRADGPGPLHAAVPVTGTELRYAPERAKRDIRCDAERLVMAMAVFYSEDPDEFFAEHSGLARLYPLLRPRVAGTAVAWALRSCDDALVCPDRYGLQRWRRRGDTAYCPICVREDVELYGVPIVRRMPQLPGTNACVRHGVRFCTAHGYNQTGRLDTSGAKVVEATPEEVEFARRAEEATRSPRAETYRGQCTGRDMAERVRELVAYDPGPAPLPSEESLLKALPDGWGVRPGTYVTVATSPDGLSLPFPTDQLLEGWPYPLSGDPAEQARRVVESVDDRRLTVTHWLGDGFDPKRWFVTLCRLCGDEELTTWAEFLDDNRPCSTECLICSYRYLPADDGGPRKVCPRCREEYERTRPPGERPWEQPWWDEHPVRVVVRW